MEISNFEGLSLSKSFEEMSLPNIIDIFNKFKASAMDDDNCEILQSGSITRVFTRLNKILLWSGSPRAIRKKIKNFSRGNPNHKKLKIFLGRREYFFYKNSRSTIFDLLMRKLIWRHQVVNNCSEIELEWSRQFHAKASDQDPVTGQMYTDLMNDLLS